LIGVPVVALSYERKVGVIMRTMGCEKQCLDIDEFKPEQVLESVRDLLTRRDDVSRDILALVARFRQQVEAQYDLVFGETQ
jgi:polysaccharide pyruvyl transferase WcaK-like protein